MPSRVDSLVGGYVTESIDKWSSTLSQALDAKLHYTRFGDISLCIQSRVLPSNRVTFRISSRRISSKMHSRPFHTSG
ncbi:MAG TPA: hypothetical protein PKK84_05870, partial [Armatimonadota bacterium]|nr:hypothetical protein [Armatimonadota bacterium]